MNGWERAVTVVAALVMIAPGVKMLFLGLALVSPMLLSQVLRYQRAQRSQPAPSP